MRPPIARRSSSPTRSSAAHRRLRPGPGAGARDRRAARGHRSGSRTSARAARVRVRAALRPQAGRQPQARARGRRRSRGPGAGIVLRRGAASGAGAGDAAWRSGRARRGVRCRGSARPRSTSSEGSARGFATTRCAFRPRSCWDSSAIAGARRLADQGARRTPTRRCGPSPRRRSGQMGDHRRRAIRCARSCKREVDPFVKQPGREGAGHAARAAVRPRWRRAPRRRRRST